MRNLWVVEEKTNDQPWKPAAIEFSRDAARIAARSIAADFTRVRRYIRDENSRS